MNDEALRVDNLSFSYPAIDEDRPAQPVLDRVLFSVEAGAFCVLQGSTGSGKTTLLRLIKPELKPKGIQQGTITLFGQEQSMITERESVQLVGYVFQNPENQIVCDTVWHELAFGLENLGLEQTQMHQRIAEACYFFGIEPWFHKKTSELSGGQKQILTLAALMVMHPKLLLLDEATSALDPLARQTFISLLYRMNQELGITVVVATHDPEPFVPYADTFFMLEQNDRGVAGVRELSKAEEQTYLSQLPQPKPYKPAPVSDEPVVTVKDLSFRYSRTAPWVIRDASLEVSKQEIRALVGGNGSGKSTLLKLIAGMEKGQRGKISNACSGSQVLLPQNPQALFTHESVEEELMEWAQTVGYEKDDAITMLKQLRLPGGPAFLARHPFDLSGGQQELLGLAKLLLTQPALVLLDEPTKGLDRQARFAVMEALHHAQLGGATIVVATHDVGLVAVLAASVSLVFDKGITVTQPTKEFLAHSWVWRQTS